MSIATVITDGFGSFGSPGLVITSGYASSTVPTLRATIVDSGFGIGQRVVIDGFYIGGSAPAPPPPPPPDQMGGKPEKRPKGRARAGAGYDRAIGTPYDAVYDDIMAERAREREALKRAANAPPVARRTPQESTPAAELAPAVTPIASADQATQSARAEMEAAREQIMLDEELFLLMVLAAC